MRAFLLTKPIFLAVDSIKFMETRNTHLFGQGWIYNVRRKFFLQMAATNNTDVQYLFIYEQPHGIKNTLIVVKVKKTNICKKINLMRIMYVEECLV